MTDPKIDAIKYAIYVPCATLLPNVNGEKVAPNEIIEQLLIEMISWQSGMDETGENLCAIFTAVRRIRQRYRPTYEIRG